MATEVKIFNEESLRADIVKQWGPAGSHVDLFDTIMRDRDRMRNAYEITEGLLKACRESRTQVRNDLAALVDQITKTIGS